MSDYSDYSDGDSEGNSSNDEPYFKMFNQDYFLSGSIEHIESWKEIYQQSIVENQVTPLKYLELEFPNLKREQNLLLAAYHIRSYAFCFYLNKAFAQIEQRYKDNCRSLEEYSQEKATALDKDLVTLTKYLQLVELATVEMYSSEIDEELVSSNYKILRSVFPMIQDKFCIWRVYICLDTLRGQDEKQSTFNIAFNMKIDYYLKTFKTIKSKKDFLNEVSLSLNDKIKEKSYLEAYKMGLVRLVNLSNEDLQKQELNSELVCDFLNCLRGMYLSAQQQSNQQSLYDLHIMNELKIPSYKNKDNFPSRHYEETYITVLKECTKQPELIDLALYINPNVIQQRGKENFGKVEELILSLTKEVIEQMKDFLEDSQRQPKSESVLKLIEPENMAALINFMVDVMKFNKPAFLKANVDIYDIFLEMAELLKKIYLSFGNDIWMFPLQLFTPLTLDFFKTISEEINDDLKNLLYEMVEKLSKDKLPEKIVLNANKELTVQKVSRLEYLSAILFYIDDCSSEEQYINLPDIVPSNFQTGILLIKSIKMKLAHHSPNEAQMLLYTEYLKECEKYKLKIDFNWFKSEQTVLERETEFQLESGLPAEAKRLFRRCLNYRDAQYANKLIKENYNDEKKMSIIEIASLLKYNHGIKFDEMPNSIPEDALFGVIEELQTMLSLQYENIFDLPLEQEININYIHLLLQFYNTKIKGAKGSNIYEQVLTKIFYPFVQAPSSNTEDFYNKYQGFFKDFIYEYLQLEVCCKLNDAIASVTTGIDFSKQLTNEQFKRLQDLKEKVVLVNEKIIYKLEGELEEIGIFLANFSSLIDHTMPFSLFYECLRLFAKLLKANPGIAHVVNYEYFFSQQRYNSKEFFSQLCKKWSDDRGNYTLTTINQEIARHVIQDYEQYRKIVSLKQTLNLWNEFKLFNPGLFAQKLEEIQTKTKSRKEDIEAKELTLLILMLYNSDINCPSESIADLFGFMKKGEPSADDYKKIQELSSIISSKKKEEPFWEQLRMEMKEVRPKDLDFLADVPKTLKPFITKGQKPLTKQEKNSFKTLWFRLLEGVNLPQWTFYYMVKLEYSSLIHIHSQSDKVILNLIKNEKLTRESYPVFKNLISENKNIVTKMMKEVLSEYQIQNSIENYHFHNKLILINEILPDQQSEEIVLKWIQKGENPLPLKIPQLYYIQYVKKKLSADFSDSIGSDYLFKVYEKPSEMSKVNQKIESLFQVLLYFPIKKYENVKLLKVEQKIEEGEGEEDWQSGSEEDTELTNLDNQLKENKVKSDDSSSSSESNDNMNEDSENDEQNDEYSYEDRPELLDIFTNEDKTSLQEYQRYIHLREQIYIYVKLKYQEELSEETAKSDEYLKEKLLAVIKYLDTINSDYAKTMIQRMPKQFYLVLKSLGLQRDREDQTAQKIRVPKKKLFCSMQYSERFSNRAENQGSQDSSLGSEEEYSEMGMQEDEYSESSSEGNQKDESPSKKIRKESDDDYDLPDLSAQFTKVESEVLGTELSSKQLMQILEIYLVQIFRLTPVNFKKKEVIYSYVEILNSQLSQTFFDSILTILRINENKSNNIKILLQKMSKSKELQSNFKIEDLTNLGDFSKSNGLENFLNLLNAWNDKNKGVLNKSDATPIRKESGQVLPMSEKLIIQLDLPLQSNTLTMMLLYLSTKGSVRNMISSIMIRDDSVKVSKKDIKKLCQIFIDEKCKSKEWEFISDCLKMSPKHQLLIALDSYSKQAIHSLTESSQKVRNIMQKSLANEAVEKEGQIAEKKTHQARKFQRLYYIVSNLLRSSSPQIMQFYYMNKNFFMKHYDDYQTFQSHKVPKVLKQMREPLFKNENFIKLVEMAFRTIKHIKDQLEKHVTPRKLSKLIKYPKMIIETANMYMDISYKKADWNFKNRSTVELFLQKYQLGEYKFASLVEVYNLILVVLEMEGFCQLKFKQLLLPYLVENRNIGLSVPLMFKVPLIDNDITSHAQSMFVTRECTFDMAFFQAKKDSLLVEFEGEEGSDHGGLIRELMQNWKTSNWGIGEEEFFIGKLIGVSFFQNVPFGGYIDLEMCVKFTNYPITYENVEFLDPEVFKTLKYISENDPEDLSLTFSVSKRVPKSLQTQQYDLKPNGRNIEVTEQNKKEYIQLYLEKYYNIGREKELEEMAVGFYTAVKKEYAEIFTPHELMRHVKGEEICDINMLKSHVKYTQGYTENSVMIKWFWEILESYNQEEMNKFVQFLTGSSKLPIFNPEFKIEIQRVYELKKLPISHTCFNTLELPEYTSKEILQKKLFTAIYEGNDSFGIL